METRQAKVAVAALALALVACLLRAARAGKVAECTEGEWHCNDGTCISIHKRCDTCRDCPYDSSDEENCERYSTTRSPKTFKCDHGQCLRMSARCNGIFDCADKSDEIGCDGVCLPGNFQCADGLCIPEEKRCDNKKDCSDDEIHCVGCSPKEFQCADKTCIPARMRCNGYVECRDTSDEQNCRLEDSQNRNKSETKIINNPRYLTKDHDTTTDEVGMPITLTQTGINASDTLNCSRVSLYFILLNVYLVVKLIKVYI